MKSAIANIFCGFLTILMCLIWLSQDQPMARGDHPLSPAAIYVGISIGIALIGYGLFHETKPDNKAEVGQENIDTANDQEATSNNEPVNKSTKKLICPKCLETLPASEVSTGICPHCSHALDELLVIDR